MITRYAARAPSASTTPLEVEQAAFECPTRLLAQSYRHSERHTYYEEEFLWCRRAHEDDDNRERQRQCSTRVRTELKLLSDNQRCSEDNEFRDRGTGAKELGSKRDQAASQGGAYHDGAPIHRTPSFMGIEAAFGEVELSLGFV